jgi:hypothetical protein
MQIVSDNFQYFTGGRLLLVIQDGLRRGLAQLKLRAHFLKAAVRTPICASCVAILASRPSCCCATVDLTARLLLVVLQPSCALSETH